MQFSGRKYCAVLFGSIMLATTGLVAINYVLDPFQVFHKSYFFEDQYLRNHRYQNAGLITHLWGADDCCDTAIIGTSMSQNNDAAKVHEAFGGKGVLNLTISGGTPAEQQQMLQYLFAKKKPARLIWDLHANYAPEELFTVNDPKIIKSRPDKFFPVYLYNNNRLGYLPYLMTIDVVKNFRKQIRKGSTLQDLHQWHKTKSKMWGKGDDIVAVYNKLRIHDVPDDSYEFPSLTQIVLPLIQENPETEFLFFIPPYSRHYYAVQSEKNYNRVLSMRRAFVEMFADYPNVKLYSFDTLFPEIDDLDRYKDPGHYHPDLNDKLIEYIAQDKGRLTPANVKENIRKTTELVNAYTRRLLKTSDVVVLEEDNENADVPDE